MEPLRDTPAESGTTARLGGSGPDFYVTPSAVVDSVPQIDKQLI